MRLIILFKLAYSQWRTWPNELLWNSWNKKRLKLQRLNLWWLNYLTAWHYRRRKYRFLNISWQWTVINGFRLGFKLYIIWIYRITLRKKKIFVTYIIIDRELISFYTISDRKLLLWQWFLHRACNSPHRDLFHNMLRWKNMRHFAVSSYIWWL